MWNELINLPFPSFSQIFPVILRPCLPCFWSRVQPGASSCWGFELGWLERKRSFKSGQMIPEKNWSDIGNPKSCGFQLVSGPWFLRKPQMWQVKDSQCFAPRFTHPVCVKTPSSTVKWFLNDLKQGARGDGGGLWPTKTPPPSRVNVPAFFNCWQAVTLPCFCISDEFLTTFRFCATGFRWFFDDFWIHVRHNFDDFSTHFRWDLNSTSTNLWTTFQPWWSATLGLCF